MADCHVARLRLTATPWLLAMTILFWGTDWGASCILHFELFDLFRPSSFVLVSSHLYHRQHPAGMAVVSAVGEEKVLIA